MPSELQKKTIDHIITLEGGDKPDGGYTNDPQDSGGPTKYGITEKTARAWGYTGDMRHLTREQAFEIYSSEYWHSVEADQLLNVSLELAEEVVDSAVNMGDHRAGEILQRCLNALNDRGNLYPDIVADGDIGPATIRTVKDYADARDVRTLVKACNCLQGAFYIELTEEREKDEKFLYGWLRNRVAL